MTIDLEKEKLNSRLTHALNRNAQIHLEAHIIHPDEKDSLNAEIHLAEERIENKLAAQRMRKFQAQLSAIARERKKFKVKGKGK